jgi:hypothetical protein
MSALTNRVLHPFKGAALFGYFGNREGVRNPNKVFELLENFWSERRDLNSGPPVPQTGALTGLRYAPNAADYSSWVSAVQPIAAGPLGTSTS